MGDLEAQNEWDGSWYDLDCDRSHPVLVQNRFGLKTVYK
jgi:hypothetical protein